MSFQQSPSGILISAPAYRSEPMQALLVHESGRYSLPDGDLIRIGSSEVCEIRLLGDPYLSRRHCSLIWLNNQLTINDLGSTHGTTVNGTSIGKSPKLLNNGDLIQIGSSRLTVILQ
ncbi:MAG: FHA domain-containing protein [Planctomycetaceae bacterium]